MKTLEITTESGTYLVVDLPEELGKPIHFQHPDRIGAMRIDYTMVWFKIPNFSTVRYELIGSGKDHPKLVEELGIYNKNPFPDNPNKFHITTSDQHEQAEKRVFKNPTILKKQ